MISTVPCRPSVPQTFHGSSALEHDQVQSVILRLDPCELRFVQTREQARHHASA
ncbi:MAG TPA: hypothetical protein VFK02_23340 [Kofleriaceae bacterium]|nr:hypothetical protein [Kofleriaceae bacterium]